MKSPPSALFYITFWISISCSMILFNKAVLDTFNFGFPIFLTAWHMVFSTILTQIMSRTTSMLPAVTENKVKWEDIKTRIIPISILFSISLIFGWNNSFLIFYVYDCSAYLFFPVAVCSYIIIFTICCF